MNELNRSPSVAAPDRDSAGRATQVLCLPPAPPLLPSLAENVSSSSSSFFLDLFLRLLGYYQVEEEEGVSVRSSCPSLREYASDPS